MKDYPSPVRFAIVGMGRIGQRHAKLIAGNADAELIAICDPALDPQTARSICPAPMYPSLHEMFASGILPDVANICTPNGYHAQQCIEAMHAGCHVVCEKPMALTSSDAHKMIRTAEETGKNIFCVMQNRYSAPSVWLKNIVEKKMLGDIFMVQINCFWNRDSRYYRQGSWHGDAQLDGGTLFTQFSHFIDTLYWIFGEIDIISARFADFAHSELTDFEDSGMVNFNIASGGLGCINYTTAVWDTNLESSMTVIGRYGSVKIAGQYMERIETCNIKGMDKPTLADPVTGDTNHRFVIQNVIETLRGTTTPDTSAHEGVRVVEIIERIYAEKCR